MGKAGGVQISRELSKVQRKEMKQQNLQTRTHKFHEETKKDKENGHLNYET